MHVSGWQDLIRRHLYSSAAHGDEHIRSAKEEILDGSNEVKSGWRVFIVYYVCVMIHLRHHDDDPCATTTHSRPVSTISESYEAHGN